MGVEIVALIFSDSHALRTSGRATQFTSTRAHEVNLNKKAAKEKCSSRQMILDGLGYTSLSGFALAPIANVILLPT